MKHKLFKKIGIFLTVLTLFTTALSLDGFPGYPKEPEISFCDYENFENPFPPSTDPPENY